MPSNVEQKSTFALWATHSQTKVTKRICCMHEKESFAPHLAEPDAWMQPNGDVFECVTVCVDNPAFHMKDPESFVKAWERSATTCFHINV